MNHGIAWGAVVALLVGVLRCPSAELYQPILEAHHPHRGYSVCRKLSYRVLSTNRARYLGNMLQFRLPSSYGDYEFKWFKIYGPVYRFERVLRAKPPSGIRSSRMPAHLEEPAFCIIAYRGEHTPFGCGGWDNLTDERKSAPTPSKWITQELELSGHGTAPIDIVPPLGIATFTAIAGGSLNPILSKSLLICSEAALGYSLDDLGEEYVAATQQIIYDRVASSTQTAGHILADALGAYLPTWLLRAALHLPTKTFKAARKAGHLAQSLGAQAVKEKHDLVQQGLNADGDIFGILLDQVHSNTERIPLTGEEIVDQTQTIMTAGQETTTKTIAFGLWELAKDPRLQESLRAEIHSSPGEAGQNGAYDQMPLLNAFIKETLRFYPAEAFAERMVVEDTIIPLSESIATSTGEQISEISMPLDLMRIYGVSAILEMQAVICELVGKFAFALPENDSVRVCMANTLQPVLSSGERGVLLRVSRLL
ncbi:cytochrome P450 [Mycena olivaceomarginata]|nr:cytochrome P450 [Mycena olivaceomarginata]